jgi:hypothetical protein
VLGAGNANDLDLAALATAFDEIHLADRDGDALSRAARRQTPATRLRLALTDVVSSDTFPLDRLFPNVDGGALLRRLDQQGRLFSGTSPALVRGMLQDDPDLACEVEDVSIIAPWLWRVAPRRTLLVCAIAFARRESVRMP